MFKSKGNLIWLVAGLVPFVVATSGCATRRYARNQVKPVAAHVDALETQTNEKIAAVSTKHESDISQVNERISTTDLRVTQVATAVQQAQGTASRAMEASEANGTWIKNYSPPVASLAPYNMVQKADVTFGFNKSTLTQETKSTLDQVVQKVQSLPRPVVEVAGFTDKVGSENYNLVLSRRRAEAVQRYLAKQNVPIRSIHLIGLGEDTPQVAGLEADVNPTATKAERNQMARRVQVRIFDGGTVEQGSASRTQQ
jgi:outer membrane protein OmpA-like peptidoglycan-associated protein